MSKHQPGFEEILDARALERVAARLPEFSLSYLRSCEDAMVMANAQGLVTFINQPGLDLLELGTLEAVTGRALWQLWPEDASDLIADAFRRAIEGNIAHITVTGLPGRRWDMTLAPIVNSDGVSEAVLVIARPL